MTVHENWATLVEAPEPAARTIRQARRLAAVVLVLFGALLLLLCFRVGSDRECAWLKQHQPQRAQTTCATQVTP